MQGRGGPSRQAEPGPFLTPFGAPGAHALMNIGVATLPGDRNRERSPRSRASAGVVTRDDVHKIAAQYGLDDKCMNDLLDLSQEMLDDVLVELKVDATCRNPNAVVTARIRDTRRRFQEKAMGLPPQDLRRGSMSFSGSNNRPMAGASSGPPPRGPPPGIPKDRQDVITGTAPANANEVEFWCQDKQLNDVATNTLKRCPDGITTVLDELCQWDLANSPEASRANSNQVFDNVTLLRNKQELEHACAMAVFLRDDCRPCSDELKRQLRETPVYKQTYIYRKAKGDTGYLDDERLDNLLQPLDPEQFLVENAIDDRCAQRFRQCSPEVLDRVVAAGDCTAAKNPSAFLIARITRIEAEFAEATQAQSHAAVRGGAAAPQQPSSEFEAQVDQYIRESGVDDRARETFLNCAWEVQQAVLANGPIQNSNNPSAVLITKIKNAKNQLVAAGYPPGMLDCFKPRSHAPQQQLPPEEEADPALVEQIEEFCRINELDETVQKALLESPDGTIEAIMQDGAFPPGCTNPSVIIMTRLNKLEKLGQREHLPYVMCFLRDNSIDEKASDQFQVLPDNIQQIVMDEGPIGGNNPSAILMNRVKMAQNGEIGPSAVYTGA